MNHVIIVGGGIAGLTAGIYAQMHGYETELFEKNAVAGGECTGWDRQGYHIDNCIHWLTGCRESDELYSLWKTIGAIDDHVTLLREPYFYMLEMDGKQLHFWRDLEKARAEFLATAPEDSIEINRFFDSVKKAECMCVPFEESIAHMSLPRYLRFGMRMKNMSSVMKEYGKETVAELAARFHHPLVQAMMCRYFSLNFLAYTLIVSYAFYTGGTAAIPQGGSGKMAERIAARYQSLGGKLHLRAPVQRILISKNRAIGVLLEDGREIAADAVICATDTAVTFSMLDACYMDRKLKTMYDDRIGYPVNSIFQAAFGILGGEPVSLPCGSVLFPCAAYTVGTQTLDFLGMRLYDYDATLFPKEKRVIQCNVLQNEQDHAYWTQLHADPAAYRAEKQRIAEELRSRILAQYPELTDRLVLLGTYSPSTFTRWCGAYHGAYMSFFPQKGRKSIYVKSTVKGLPNVFLASQWLQCNGGLPSAATSGKFAVQALLRAER